MFAADPATVQIYDVVECSRSMDLEADLTRPDVVFR